MRSSLLTAQTGDDGPGLMVYMGLNGRHGLILIMLKKSVINLIMLQKYGGMMTHILYKLITVSVYPVRQIVHYLHQTVITGGL